MKHPPIEQLVDQMTLREQVAILSGEDFWSLPAIPRLGIGKMRVTDGPNGARGSGSLFGGVTSAAFPVGIAIGASWDPLLAGEIGAAIAEEVKSKGAHMSLAPTVNIQRTVTNGRNFECYSEDPELAAALAVGYIRGMQAVGVAATIKHFAGNESEIERTTINSEIDERSLREIYLRPFEDAVRQAGTWGVMSSYNKLNGTYAAENHWLLTEVLRGDWGFDGVIMSDWFGSRSTAATVNAGLDLEMPGPTRDRGDRLIAAVEAGEVDAASIRECALNLLRLLQRTGALTNDQPLTEIAEDRPAHRALIRRAGAAATVLLKNDGLLPLASADGGIAVIGPNARVAQIMGGGSAQLNPHYRVSPWDALLQRCGEAALHYAEGCSNFRWEPLIEGDFDVEFFEGKDFAGEPLHRDRLDGAQAFFVPPVAAGKVMPDQYSARISGSYRARSSGIHRIGIHAAGYARVIVDGQPIVDLGEARWVKGRTFFEEGCDEVVGEISLEAGRQYRILIEFTPKNADNLHFSAFRVGLSKPLGDADIDVAVAAAAAADTALVFVGRSGEWDTEGSDLTDIALPGRQDELVAAVLAVNPKTVVILQTGGPVEMPWIDAAPAVMQAWYPGQECGNAIVDVLFGDADPGGRLPQTFPLRWQDNPTATDDPEIYPGHRGKVRYAEGLFIGYRHYDRANLAPLFAFGHGLSYTRFELDNLSVDAVDDGALARCTVTNCGHRAGATVVQLYVADDVASVERPVRELKGFARVQLEPGEKRELEFELPARAFAWFDGANRCWRVEAGEFTLAAGFSAVDLRAQAGLRLGDRKIPL